MRQTFNRYTEKVKTIHLSHYEKELTQHEKRGRLVLFVIALVVMSQLALTIYLPSMPAMVTYFKTDAKHLQYTIMLYLLGYGISQFIYGPLSDNYGRRIIILSGLTVFIIASFLCTFPGTITVLLVGRFLQGIGMGCGDTMGRAILCDQFKEKEFIKAASQIGMAATVTPMLAPIIGGYIQTYLSWWVNFLLILMYAVGILVLVFLYLPETKPRNFHVITTLRGIINTYAFISKNRYFIGFFIPGMICFVGETIYNMMTPFIFQNSLHWSAVEFGWSNIVPIVGLLIGTLIANYASKYISYTAMVRVGMCVLCASAMLMLLPGLYRYTHALFILLPMMLFMAGVGMIYPNTNMGALNQFTAMAGSAGALQGGLQMVSGGILSSLVVLLPMSTQLPLALILSVLSLAGMATFLLILPRSVKVEKTAACVLSTE